MTSTPEQVRQACARLELPVDDRDVAVLSGLLAAYSPALDALRTYSHEEGLDYDERAIAFTPPANARAQPGAGGTDGEGLEWSLTHAAQAIARIKQHATPTNAFISASSAPETLPAGPLNGVNFAVKDCITVGGEPTMLGSSFAGREPATTDSPLVAQLRNAGASYVGKTNLGEFAITVSSPHFGEVANPWNLEHTAGGSSGGSAAAVAAGEVDLALGTDNAGSVRIPAAMCGVVGFRPTTGSLPLLGVVAPAWTLDGYGLFGRDVLAVTNAIAELEWKRRPDMDRRPLVVGTVTDGSLGAARPEVADVYNRTLEAWDSSEVELRPISLPELELAAPAAALIAYVEVAVQHEPWIRTHWQSYGSESRQLVCLGNLFTGVEYVLAQRARVVLRRRFAHLTSTVDAIVTPTLALTAPRLGGNPSVSGEGDKPALFEIIRFTALANMIGAPAISVPVGLSPQGLPVAVQIMAQPWADPTVLRVAADLEASARFHARPPCYVDSGNDA